MVESGCCGCTFEDTDYLSGVCGSVGQVAVFMSLLDVVLRSQCSITDPCRRAYVPKPEPSYVDITNFDFVVVGGGVAGSVVATRLSEKRDHKVLLLEAGPEDPTYQYIPAFFDYPIGTKYDWQYKTVPQKNACLADNGVCDWPRGKMMGGSGNMAGMMYTRGNQKIYNEWEKNGNKGWSYLDVLHYFKKAENNSQPSGWVEEGYHGFGGPLPVTKYPYAPANITWDILKGAREMGYRLGDLNGRNQTGFALGSVMQANGLRASTYRMYLRPFQQGRRKNLYVQTTSYVTKILLDDDQKRAVGVQYVDNKGNVRKAKATKEVILCGGVVGSPKLLLLSGIGPKKDLSKLNISSVLDLPVGKNLHYHVSIKIDLRIHGSGGDAISNEVLNEYVRNRSGILSGTALKQVTGFIETSRTIPGLPDIQVYFDGFEPVCSKYRASGTSATTPNNNSTLIDFRPVFMLSKTRGDLTLSSANPDDYPLIDPKYLENEEDVETLLEAIKILKRLSETKSFAKWNTEFDATKRRCPTSDAEYGSDDYWRCIIRRYTLPENHHAGTCKMGPAKDKTAVVDSKLRLHGLKNIRVVDASIFPSPVNSNTIGPIVMVAEKAADMIKAAWTKKYSFPAFSNLH